MSSKYPGSTICLINPPSVFLLDERVFVNLGLLKVAAALEQAGYNLDVVDLSGIRDYQSALRDYLVTNKTLVFGITTTTPQMPQVTAIRDLIRSTRPEARIILGGPHVTLVHTAARKEMEQGTDGRGTKALRHLEERFDVLVSGYGEKAVFEALVDNPPKLVNANEKTSPLFISNNDYNASPFPSRHLVDLRSYHYSIDDTPATSLIAQLGCPFSCGFCGGRESPCLRIVRTRSTGQIVSEIESIHLQYGYRGFMFYDDELNVNPHLIELLDQITALQRRLNVEFRFRGFIKAELFNDEQAAAMYRAGFRWILSGFESGSPRILENICKRATREDNTRCMEIARRHGLKVKALMSIGHPGESPDTVEQTRQWLTEMNADDFDITIITPYPGTAYYDNAVPVIGKEGLWVYRIPSNGDCLYSYEVDYATTPVYYKGDPNDGYRAYTYTDYLTSEDLVSSRGELERSVRAKLGIPFYQSQAAMQYEHSMGQSRMLPEHILKSSSEAIAA